jgi:lysophospholipase L1-like esterase
MRKVTLQWLAVAVAVILLVFGLTVWFFATVPIPNKIHVACVGDSITAGSLYPKDLEALLGANCSVGNFGIGLAAVNLNSEKPYINQTVFSNAKDSLPNIIIIMLGTNDANPTYQQYLDNFNGDYKKLIGEFEALPTNPKIWLVVPPPIFNDSLGLNSTILTQQVIPRIRQVASELNLPIIDVYSALANHPEYFSDDGVHPTVEGSRIIATTIFEAITK